MPHYPTGVARTYNTVYSGNAITTPHDGVTELVLIHSPCYVDS
jgi:hypothetical protein